MNQVVILRGVSGSGKSTVAKSLTAIVDVGRAVIVSADNFFVTPQGNYEFNGDKLGSAHEHCLNEFKSALTSGVELVIVDNTNTQHWEYQAYVKEAARFNYNVDYEMVGSLEPEMLVKYAERNSHSVPLDAIQRQAKRFEY